MKLPISLFIVLFVIAALSPAYGQGTLRAPGGGGGSGARGLTAPSAPATPPLQRPPSSPTNPVQPPSVTVPQNPPVMRSLPQARPPVSSLPGRPRAPSGPSMIEIPSAGRGPTQPVLRDRLGHPRPPRPPRPPHFLPGVVIWDWPWSYGTTIVTEVAPGVLQEERRYADEPSGGVPERGPGRLAPYDPTPHEIVERMLSLARVKKGDVIYDLGSGDGRILIAAAQKYGVRGVGYEIDAGLVKLARENVRRAGVDKLVEIRQEDFLAADLSPASVVTLYLSYDGNLAVRSQLNLQLKPGARVVSYTFDMGEWQPKITESYRDEAGDVHIIYVWEIAKQVFAPKPSGPIIEPYPQRQGPLIIEVN